MTEYIDNLIAEANRLLQDAEVGNRNDRTQMIARLVAALVAVQPVSHTLTGETSDDHPYKGRCSCSEWGLSFARKSW